MRSWLSNLLKNLFGDSVARVLGGAGLSLVSAAVMIPLVTTLLNQAASALGGVSGDMLAVIGMFGFGEAISIMGSAMLTRLTIQSTSVGIKKAANAS